MKLGNLDNIDSPEKKTHIKTTEPVVPTEVDKRKLDNLSSQKRKPDIRGVDASKRNYHMNTPSTMYEIGKRMNPKSQEFYTKALYSGDTPRAKLIGKGKEFYMTGEKASGNFLTKEYPGKNATERRENLQLPKSNDGKKVIKVKSTRPQVVIESNIAAQPEWAKENGYKARQGIKQIYTPNTNPEGAISDKRYEKVKKHW